MSKANQAFKQNEEAVSPVIGVILMVAITVVLAAVVFVLVSNLSKNSNASAPNISFSQDKSGKTLTIVSADAANWKDIKATITGVTSAGANQNLCTGTDAAGTAIPNATPTALTPGTISAGNKLVSVDSAAVPTGDVCTLKL